MTADFSDARAYVVGAYVAAGGAFVNYRIARILAERFSLETKIVNVGGEGPQDSWFEYENMLPAISLDELAEQIRPQDILLMSPSNSHLWLGKRLSGKKIMNVQGVNTFSLIDPHFDKYVAVSSYCQSFLSTMYGLTAEIISPFVTHLTIQTPSWGDRVRNVVLVNGKGDSNLWRLLLEEIQGGVHAQHPDVVFMDIRENGAVRHSDLLETLSRHRYLLTLSPVEGFGLVPLEAMQLGLAVTGFDGMGGRDYMIYDGNSACVPFGSVSRVTEALLKFLNEDDYPRSLGLAGQETARHYSEDLFVSRWTNLLEEYLVSLGSRSGAGYPAKRQASISANTE